MTLIRHLAEHSQHVLLIYQRQKLVASLTIGCKIPAQWKYQGKNRRQQQYGKRRRRELQDRLWQDTVHCSFPVVPSFTFLPLNNKNVPATPQGSIIPTGPFVSTAPLIKSTAHNGIPRHPPSIHLYSNMIANTMNIVSSISTRQFTPDRYTSKDVSVSMAARNAVELSLRFE